MRRSKVVLINKMYVCMLPSNIYKINNLSCKYQQIGLALGVDRLLCKNAVMSWPVTANSVLTGRNMHFDSARGNFNVSAAEHLPALAPRCGINFLPTYVETATTRNSRSY